MKNLLAFLLARLKEGSTWAVIFGILVGTVGLKIPEDLWGYLAAFGAAGAALLGFLLRDTGAKV